MAVKGITGDIVHTVGVRYRIRGSGYLRTRLYNMGNISTSGNSLRSSDLENLGLGTKNNREKTAIANFQDQGIQIYFRTIHIDETINLTKIVCFVKPVADSYPIKSGGN